VRTCVVALGKIGLPLAVQMARSGHQVVGADVDPRVVDAVNRGEEPFPGEHGLAEGLAEVVASGALRATTDTTAAVAASEATVVVVPLFTDDLGVPDFRAMDAATDDIGAGLQPGSLVTYETTLPVGTTRQRFVPALEARSGLRVGTDLHVVFSPERVLTGRVFADLRRYPKLVGGVDAASAAAGAAFYESALQFDERPDLPRPNGVWDLGSAEAAEMAKLAETTYRDVNIGLANQFARHADAVGLDVRAVIEAANSQPYSHIHTPGIAVGGHCIPIYPRMYLWKDPGATVVSAAREANLAMPAYAVARLAEAMGSLEGATVAVLGAAYRGGVKEVAFSGVFPTVEALREAGADVRVHDPLYTDAELEVMGLRPHALGTPVDAVVLQADHAQYRELTTQDVPGARVLLDGRGTTDAALLPGVRRLLIGDGQAPATPRPGAPAAG